MRDNKPEPYTPKKRQLLLKEKGVLNHGRLKKSDNSEHDWYPRVFQASNDKKNLNDRSFFTIEEVDVLLDEGATV